MHVHALHTPASIHAPAQALRTCPVCRTTTHFITPSTSWPETPEDKEAIVAAYKAKMAAIDCM